MSSLRVQLKKFRFQGKITSEEYESFIKKLDGHDDQIRADERTKAFKEFVDSYREFNEAPSEEACLKNDIECDGMCIDCFERWFKEKKNEQDNNSDRKNKN